MGAAGDAKTLPVVPHQGQAQAQLGGYFSLSSDARFQPRIYTVKSKIPGRQGLARWEHRCCLYPAAVIMPPNLESSGRAVCSATIRRLFNCSAIVYCFLLPGSSRQHPAEHQEPHCKPRHAGCPVLPARASSEHRCCGDARGQTALGTTGLAPQKGPIADVRPRWVKSSRQTWPEHPSWEGATKIHICLMKDAFFQQQTSFSPLWDSPSPAQGTWAGLGSSQE